MSNFVVVGGILLFSFFVFLVGRAIVLWYFKIDKIVELLTAIERNTRKMANESATVVAPPLSTVDDREVVMLDDNKTYVSNWRVIVDGQTWRTGQLQKVKVDNVGDEPQFTLKDLAGNQLLVVTSDDSAYVARIADAVNRAVYVSRQA